MILKNEANSFTRFKSWHITNAGWNKRGGMLIDSRYWLRMLTSSNSPAHFSISFFHGNALIPADLKRAERNMVLLVVETDLPLVLPSPSRESLNCFGRMVNYTRPPDVSYNGILCGWYGFSRFFSLCGKITEYPLTLMKDIRFLYTVSQCNSAGFTKSAWP